MFFDKSGEEINREDLIPRKDFERLQQVVDVHQDYLNTLYVFYKFKPTPFLERIRDLSYELLRFVDNVCSKHDLTYWMDYGTLLGAVRHGDFVPWDDDLNVGMMRADYVRLAEILPGHIDDCGLENVSCNYGPDQKWMQINYRGPDFADKLIGINVFPYDYVKGEAIEGIEVKYDEYGLKFENSSQFIDDLYSQLNLTFERDEHYIPGVEGIHGKDNRFKFKIRETDLLFPLRKLQFGKYEFPAPNDSLKYIRKIHGKKFISIPNKKPKNNRLVKYREIKSIEEILKKSCDKLKEVNDNHDFR
ncbi:LicD family protein [Methanobrevibacter sp.]|uniref:LicD family protein n=1 Tax=Methanobrevibacter sp. TaxID=66852 RepID=UPI0025F00D33|nr:LicD family protein [Methanobrevibacter sp.]MBR4448494.1 LicD family protein [Methanobrevibacter sp.]